MTGAPIVMAKDSHKSPSKSKENLKSKATAPDINQAVRDLVGKVDNLFEIKVHNVFEDYHRINVWIKYQKKDLFGCSYKIKHSYFVKFADGKLTDLTKPPSKENKRLLL